MVSTRTYLSNINVLRLKCRTCAYEYKLLHCTESINCENIG